MVLDLILFKYECTFLRDLEQGGMRFGDMMHVVPFLVCSQGASIQAPCSPFTCFKPLLAILRTLNFPHVGM